MIWGTGVTPAELALYYQGWCDAPADGAACTHHNTGSGVGGTPSSGTDPLILDFERATGSEKFVIAATSLTDETHTHKDGTEHEKIKAEGGITVDLGITTDANAKTSVDWVIANIGTCDDTDCDASTTPMSFEKLFTDADDKTQILGWLEDWDDYNGDNSLAKPIGLVAHLSPERGGVADIPPVPVPAAIWLFGTALIGFIGISRRTNVA